MTITRLTQASDGKAGPYEVTGTAGQVVATPAVFTTVLASGTVFRSSRGGTATPVGSRTDITKVFPGNGNPYALSATGVLYRLVNGDWQPVTGIPSGVYVVEAMATPGGSGDVTSATGAWALLSDGRFAYIGTNSTAVSRIVSPPVKPIGSWWGTGSTAGFNPALGFTGEDGLFHVNIKDGSWNTFKSGNGGNTSGTAMGMSGETSAYWFVGWTSDGSVYNWGEYSPLRARYVRSIPGVVDAIYGTDVITALTDTGKAYVTRWDNTTGTNGVTELKQAGGALLPGPVSTLRMVRGSSDDAIVFVIDGQVWGAQTDETSNYSNAKPAQSLPGGVHVVDLYASGSRGAGVGNVYVLASDNAWYRANRNPSNGAFDAWTPIGGLPAGGTLISIAVGQNASGANSDGWAVVGTE